MYIDDLRDWSAGTRRHLSLFGSNITPDVIIKSYGIIGTFRIGLRNDTYGLENDTTTVPCTLEARNIALLTSVSIFTVCFDARPQPSIMQTRPGLMPLLHHYYSDDKLMQYYTTASSKNLEQPKIVY